MSKIKFTPGPWKFHKSQLKDGSPYIQIKRSDGKSSYSIANIGDRMPSAAQWEPNAALIAAAPEMYEAIDALLKDTLLSEGTTISNWNLVHQLKDALAKARGEK